MSTPHPDQVTVPPIVDASWLRDRLTTDPTLTICHVGSTMVGPDPEQSFTSGHLPGARFVSLDDVLAAPPSGTAGRHPLPAPADFARALGDLGVGDDATVVAYDDRGGAFAGRLVWMLRILGQRAALLDGGIEGWLAEPDAELEVERGADHRNGAHGARLAPRGAGGCDRRGAASQRRRRRDRQP
jgi:thiosulfate/3-mercaptopyruvate sulfurtransferase